MSYTPQPRSNGTIQTTRKKLPWPKDRLFRILSIDGGGIRGVYPAAILAEIESRFLQGNPITNYFDMIAGTSTGGIIALALASGMTAKDTLKIYTERGNIIFPTPSGLSKYARLVRWAIKPKHDQNTLKEELLRVFDDKVIDAARTRLIIPSFEGLYGEPFIYKTPHHPDYQKDRHKRFAHVALHTTAAPSYYPAVGDDGHIMIDGGVWANNPVMNAVVDALACYDVPRENIRVLSLGTGEAFFSLDKGAQNGGGLHWFGLKPFTIAARAQSKNALGQTYLLAGKQNVVRLDPPESDRSIALDDVSRALRELPAAATASVEGAGHYIQSLFLTDPVDPYIRCPVA